MINIKSLYTLILSALLNVLSYLAFFSDWNRDLRTLNEPNVRLQFLLSRSEYIDAKKNSRMSLTAKFNGRNENSRLDFRP